MGTKGKAIVGIRINDLIKLLNSALADEWQAYYQYWIGAKVIKGPMKEAAIAELLQHAADELRHAEMVSGRIIQLGGTPVLTPVEWAKVSNCGYDAPKDPFIKKVLQQNIKGEQCAIEVYNQIVKLTKDKDLVTFNMAVQIMTDEVEHEEDLQALLEDFETMKRSFK